jgi:hypothetical protein
MFVIRDSNVRDSSTGPVNHRYVDCIAPFTGKLKSTRITKQLS